MKKKYLVECLRQVPEGKTCKLEAGSWSMLPAIKKGDELVMRRVKFSQVKRGDVIVYNDEIFKQVTVHRVVKIIKRGSKISFLTKGDSNRYQDKEVVDKKNFIGKVELVRRKILGGFFLRKIKMLQDKQ